MPRNALYSTDDLEILVSTMYQSDFGFLKTMFQHNTLSDYAILIINQTDESRQLLSSEKNIRVINTAERGLPQSRNMALENAQKKICLVADDDVVYEPGFEEVIIAAHNKNKDATAVTFQMINHDGDLYQDYKNIPFCHNHKTLIKINGVVISLNRKKILENRIFYNNHFGIGATFECANEYVFMKNVLNSGGKAYFEPKVILSHPNFSTGSFGGDDKIIKARSAFHYKYYGWWAYLWVFKYIRFNVAHGQIKLREIESKIRTGFKGIAEYRQLIKRGLEKRN